MSMIYRKSANKKQLELFESKGLTNDFHTLDFCDNCNKHLQENEIFYSKGYYVYTTKYRCSKCNTVTIITS